MKFKLIFFLAIIASMMACVDSFDPGLVGKDRKLVVDCLLTDKTDYVKIQLSYSAGYNSTESVYDKFASGATITISGANGEKFNFYEDNGSTGFYTSSKPVAGKIGQTYTLNIKIDGKEYQSNPEKMLPVSTISNVTTKYERNRELNPKAIGRFELFVDTKDPAERTDFYRWDYKHYERPDYCRRQRRVGSGGEAIQPIIGYKCCEDCWNVTICNACINIASDEYANGSTIARQNIGSVPYDSRTPYYLVIEQQSLTKEAYTFWRTVKEQSSNSGGIFDAPPTYIRGNIVNIKDPNELVLGYFSASAVSTKAFYLDRTMPFEPFTLKGTFNVDEISENCEPCKETNLRTGIKPEGWFDLN